MPAHFEWDATKAATNLARHGIAFEHAVAVGGYLLGVNPFEPWAVRGPPSRWKMAANAASRLRSFSADVSTRCNWVCLVVWASSTADIVIRDSLEWVSASVVCGGVK